MKNIYFGLLLMTVAGTVTGQQFHIDSTRFITGNKPGTSIFYSIPTADKGILFAGSESLEPGGIVPSFPLDKVYENAFIGKIDSQQKIAWLKVYGGTKDDYAAKVCQTPDGGYAVLASTLSDDGNITDLKGASDIWLLRLDASGNLMWQKTYGSSDGDVPVSIAVTPDGGFIILGATNGSDYDVPFHYGGSFSLDWLIIKTDAAGNIQWSKVIGGTGDEQYYGTILSVGDSYYIASGTTSRDHDCIDTAWHTGVNTGEDAYLLKLDNAGNVLWGKSYGGSATEVFYSAIYDDRDNTLVMTGIGYSSDYMLADQHGEGDMFTVKTDMDGNVIWHKAIGYKAQDEGHSIIKYPYGGYLLLGSTFPSPDTTTPGYIGGADNLLFTLDHDGNELAYKVFGGKPSDAPSCINPYMSSYVVTGTSASAIFTEGTSNINLSGAFVTYLGAGALSIDGPQETQSSINVYPNPSNKSVRIAVSESNGKGNLSITNGNGKIMWEKHMRPDDIDVDIQSWSDGWYIVQWQAHNGTILTAKFVKN